MTPKLVKSRAVAGTRDATEWLGGITTMNAFIHDGDAEPYRPQVALWMRSDGAVIGSTLGARDELAGLAAKSLQEAIEHPLVGSPGAPARVRVASEALAAELRRSHPGIEIVCAATPELDELFAHLDEQMDGDTEPESSYLGPGISPEAVAAFFRAAARLHRAKPWKIVPGDDTLFSLTIEALGLRDAVISVIGQMAQSFGCILFSNIDDYEAYLEAAERLENGEKPVVPRHFALCFERGADLAPALRREIAAHGWQVAGSNAYPSPIVIEPDLASRPPSAREFAIAEAMALALPVVLAEKAVLHTAWDGGTPVSFSVPVEAHTGELVVELRTPYEIDFDASPPDEDNEDLLEQFHESPEGQTLAGPRAAELLADLANDYFTASLTTLAASELREILVSTVPARVSMEPADARPFIEDLRCLYRFLGRVHGLRNAPACLRVLGDRAIPRLEAALADPAHFGLAKSLMSAGADAGFDMATREGIDAWMEALKSRPLPTRSAWEAHRLVLSRACLRGPAPALRAGTSRGRRRRGAPVGDSLGASAASRRERAHTVRRQHRLTTEASTGDLERLASVTSEKRRRHYGHAAHPVAACVACDPSPGTARWAAALCAEHRRYPAHRAELDRALGAR